MLRRLLLSLLLLSATVAGADTPKPLSEVERLRQSLSLLLPDVVIDSIRPSPVSGLYEVAVGPQLVYMTPDGRYMLEGDLTDLELRKNLTRPRVRELRLQTLQRLGEDKMLIFAAERPRFVVTVFTDIDCGYCRKMHREIGQYNDLGITIRYLLFPRAGVGSASWVKAVSAWCADDRKAAFTAAKQGKKIPERTLCDNPINSHLALGTALGVTGTPALILPDGSMLPGYLPADRMAQMLERLGQPGGQRKKDRLQFRHQ